MKSHLVAPTRQQQFLENILYLYTSASALACPDDSTAAVIARNSYKFLRAFSAAWQCER